MSILVGKPFKLKIWYIEHFDEEDAQTGVSIVPEDTPDAKLLVCECKGASFDALSQVVSNASLMNHITGKSNIQPRMYCRQLILTFFTSWDAVDDDGYPIPLNSETINDTYYPLIKRMVQSWTKKTRGK